jgi:hypothetical protein
MLTPRPGGDAHCGPFFEVTSLTAVYEELVKLLVQAAGTFTMFFKASSKNDYTMKLSFMEAAKRMDGEILQAVDGSRET